MLQPMKPAKLDLRNDNHKAKLEHYFNSPLYVAEPKIDGCHYFLSEGRFLSTLVSKKTNNLVDKTENFPHLVEGFQRATMGSIILDGEINYSEGQKSYDVTKITGCNGDEAVRRQEAWGWINYTIFDVLRDGTGTWLYGTPWHDRRAYLEYIMPYLTNRCKYFNINLVYETGKRELYERIINDGGEGIVFKYKNGFYYPGKRPMDNWIKLKTTMEDDVVIVGYELPVKEYSGKDILNWNYWENALPVTKYYHNNQIGSIIFGKYAKNGQLITLGSCSGMDDETREWITKNKTDCLNKVMTIKAMEMTPDGKYRHPNFIKMHSDKNPFECVIE